MLTAPFTHEWGGPPESDQQTLSALSLTRWPSLPPWLLQTQQSPALRPASLTNEALSTEWRLHIQGSPTRQGLWRPLLPVQSAQSHHAHVGPERSRPPAWRRSPSWVTGPAGSNPAGLRRRSFLFIPRSPPVLTSAPFPSHAILFHSSMLCYSLSCFGKDRGGQRPGAFPSSAGSPSALCSTLSSASWPLLLFH